MKRQILICVGFVVFGVVGCLGQVPLGTLVQISKAEDARRYDAELAGLMKSPNADVRKRAALAAGRIGNDAALAVLSDLLEKDNETAVRELAAFAIGEIESVKGSEAILRVLSDTRVQSGVRARAVEAAGKIAAANAKDEKAKALGAAIVEVLNFENSKRSAPYTDVVRLGITAALRSRPEGAAEAVKNFLGYSDAAVVADALNTLTRLRAKTSTGEIRDLLARHTDPMVRANAARALGAAEDKDALEILLKAATTDADPRVRVAAIRSLGSLKDAKAADKLIERGEALIGLREKSKFPKPVENAELLEVATALGRLIPETENAEAVIFLGHLRAVDGYSSSETEIAYARIAPKLYVARDSRPIFLYSDPNAAAAYGQGLAELASAKNDELTVQAGQKLASFVAGMLKGVAAKDQDKMLRAMPELTRSMAALKPDNLDQILRGQIGNGDVFIRAVAAELLAERPLSKENFAALEKAFTYSLLQDKIYDDAMLAIMDALAKLDKKAATGSLLMALNSQDYLVRKKAFELLEDKELEKTSPGIPAMLALAREKHKDQVQPYSPVFGTKLGQVLNSDIDYRRALSRKNGSVSAVLTTEKGVFTIVFNPEKAPLTVDNWVRLARSGYFNGLEVHRVVPNFVMQDGDPRGDGNGGPGWSIRCEVNMLPYDRGAVGMALSGKDTGGSQWFVTHSPQPHLDGGYTVFGHVSETDMKVVDNIVRGDKIISVKIVEGSSPSGPQKRRR